MHSGYGFLPWIVEVILALLQEPGCEIRVLELLAGAQLCFYHLGLLSREWLGDYVLVNKIGASNAYYAQHFLYLSWSDCSILIWRGWRTFLRFCGLGPILTLISVTKRTFIPSHKTSPFLSENVNWSLKHMHPYGAITISLKYKLYIACVRLPLLPKCQMEEKHIFIATRNFA